MENESIIDRMYYYLDKINENHNTNMDEDTNTVIYISIGSACITKSYDMNKQLWTVIEGRDQQSPPFIDDIKNKYPKTNFHIWLLDPAIESPPFITCDKTSIIPKLDDKWVQKDSHTYENLYESITVYSFKNKITYYNNYMNFSDGIISNLINIGSFFDKLNSYAINNDWFVVVQDYSGNDINRIAYYYDLKPYIIQHRDHIIYGLGSRTENSCLINLTKPQYRFRFINKDETNNKIKVFNPYMFSKFNKEDLEISKDIIQEFLTYKKNYIIDNYVRLMRQLKLFLNGNKVKLRTVSDLYIDKSLYKTISNITLNPSIESCQHLLNILKSKLLEELVKYILYVYDLINVDEIINYIENIDLIDEYKWYNNMKIFIDQIIKIE